MLNFLNRVRHMASDLETGTNNDIEKCYFKSELKRDDIVTAKKKQKQKNQKKTLKLQN